MNTPFKLILHHTGGTDANPLADTSHHTMEMVRQWHKAKGWDDIGYNWYCEKDGTVKAGRSEKIAGAHTVGQNSISIGFCFAGNFDVTYPTKEQEEGFKNWYRLFIKKYPNITPENVYPHRKYANKTCYGKLLKDDWGAKLAQKALDEVKPEIKDDTKESFEFCQKENNEMKGILQKIFELLSAILKRSK